MYVQKCFNIKYEYKHVILMQGKLKIDVG